MMLVFVLNTSKTHYTFWITLSASCIPPTPPHHPPRYHMSDCISTATNNHVYWKQAIEVGAGLIICSCQEDSAETQPLYYHYNNQGGFLPRCFLISVDFLSHVEKNLRFVFFFNKKEKPLNMMSWTGSSTKCDCLIWCSPWMEMLHTFLLLGGEKGHEGECYLYKPKYYLTQGSVLSWSKGRDVLVIYQKVDCNFQRKC